MRRLPVILLALAAFLPMRAQGRLETVSPVADSLAAQPFRAYLDSIRAKRPAVALVLSGGGAKGAAHVGALRYMESIGMPVDIILGTSIGGLIGGLYSVGYRADDLDTLIRGMDWPSVLGDLVPARYVSYDKKIFDARMLMSVPFKGLSQLGGISRETFSKEFAKGLPAGLVAGQNVGNLLSSLTVSWQDSLSFARLPIPFVCVATDMVSGKAKVWYGGSLLAAMRSTMSIPGLFAPVKTGGMVLVDGGMRDNYPLDLARDLGADIVIGVNLSQGFKSYEQMNNMMDIMVQMSDLFGRQTFENNLPIADVSIHPDLKGYDMLSFEPEAISIMIDRGYEAALSKAGELETLLQRVGERKTGAAPSPVNLEKDKVHFGSVSVRGLEESASPLTGSVSLPDGALGKDDIEDVVTSLFGTGAFETVSYSVFGSAEPYDLVLDCKKAPANRAGFGARFDKEELVSVLVNLGFGVNSVKGSSFELTGKIGVNPYLSAVYAYKTGLGLVFGAESFYRYVDRNNFYWGKNKYHAVYHQFRQSLYLSGHSRGLAALKAGIRAEYTDICSLLAEVRNQGMQTRYNYLTDNMRDTYFSVFAKAVLDNTDDVYFPTKGLAAELNYSWTPFVWRSGKTNFHRLNARLSAVLPAGGRLALIPSAYASAVAGGTAPLPFVNLAGGLLPGRYLDSQVPFAGFGSAFATGDYLCVGRVDARFRLAENHYVTATYNIAADAPSFADFCRAGRRGTVHGEALEYAWNTIAGPFRLGLWWNSMLRRTSFYFCIGKNF